MTRPWPKVSAHGNDNGDWRVQEEGGTVIADLSKGAGQHERLVEQMKIAATPVCDHFCVYDEDAHGVIHGAPCITFRAVLASESGHGCTETDSATQERNAKRIALGLDAVRRLMETPEHAVTLDLVADICREAMEMEDAG